MKKITIVLFGLGICLSAYGQSTFGPRSVNDNGNSTGRVEPSSYYSPVTTDPSTPTWGCSQYRDNRNPATPPYQGANAVAGFGGMTSWNSSDYKAFTYKSPGYQGTTNFRLLFPPGYDQNNTSKKYPLIIFLHGKGEAGQDSYNYNSCDVRYNNNDHQLIWGGQNHRNIVFSDTRYEAIILFPQNDFGAWVDGNAYSSGYYNLPDAGSMSGETRRNIEMLEFLMAGNATTDGKICNIDPNRVYIEGLSLGGGGVWDAIVRRPDLFAGAIPMSSAGTINQANLLSYMGIWYWQGGIDTNPVPLNGKNAIQAIQAASGFRRDASFTDISTGVNGSGTATNTYVGSARYIEESTYGHGVFTDAYNHPDFWRWLFAQNQLNIKTFGDTALCSGSTLRIGVVPGLAEYDWQYSTDNITYSSALPGGIANTTNDLNVSVLGYYRVRIRRTFTGWTNYSQPIQIISKAPAVAPIITLDNSTILPSLSGSTVILSAPAGMAVYNWSNLATTQNITVSTSGNYSVSVTPVNGCPSPFSASYTILTGQTPNASIANPSNLTISSVSATSLQLSWADNANNETGYEIYRSFGPSLPYIFVGLINTPNTTTFTDTGLLPNTSYTYQVRAIRNGIGASDYVGPVASTTNSDTAPPSAPTNLRTTNVSTNVISLTWDASTDNVGITAYDVYQDGVVVASVGSPGYTATGLTTGTIYTYYVKARDAANNTSLSSNSLAVTTYSLVSGVINYSYYEGSFANLNNPLFNNQTPVKTGYTTPFSLVERLTNINIGFNFTGIIAIPTTGDYTFFTESDDGSNLFIDGVQVVFNDYNQGMTERNGVVNGLTAGNHTIQVTYRQGGGGFGLNVRWQGPSITKALIPASVISGYSPGNVYYSKSSGNLTATATWGSNPDGSGNAPANFTTANQTFYINRAATLNANWTVSGTSSKIIVMNGGVLTVPTGIGFTGQINLEGTGALIIQNGALFSTATFGNISSGSTVRFAAGMYVPAVTYGNLILGSTSPADNTTKNFQTGTVTVLGNMTVVSGSIATDPGAILALAGNLTLNGNVSLPIDIQAIGGSQTFTGNGNPFNTKSLTLNSGTTVTLSNLGGTSNLTASGNIVLNNLSTLDIKNNILTVGTAGLINSGTQTGFLSSNSGSLILNSNSSGSSNLYFTPTSNSLNNLTVNVSGGGNLNLKNTAKFTGTLKLQAGNLNSTAGSLTLVSNAAGTGRVDKVENGASLTGNLTVQRYFSGSDATTKGWFHIGTTVKGQKVSDWASDATVQGPWMPNKTASIQYFREDTLSSYPSNSIKAYENLGWYGTLTPNDNINTGKGFRMYLYNEFFNSRNATLDNTGLPVIGDGTDGVNNTGEFFPFNVTFTTSPSVGFGGGGWNLVANPYPSDIDWKLPTWIKTNVATTVYVWDAKANNGKGQYSTYNTTTSLGTNGGTGQIAMGQAFLVKATAANPVLRVNEDAKIATFTPLLRTSNSGEENTLRIKLLNKAGESDEAIIFFYKNATTGFDENLDVLKFYGGSLNLSSLTSDGKDVAMNALPNGQGSIKLNLKDDPKGTYSLNFSGVASFGSLPVQLVDKFLNTLTDITANPVYNFTITEEANSTGSGRFELVFGTVQAIAETFGSEFELEQNVPNPFSNETLIRFYLPSAGKATLSVYNTIGVKLDTMTLDGKAGSNAVTWNATQRLGKVPENGVYIYKIQSGNKVLSRRMMVVK